MLKTEPVELLHEIGHNYLLKIFKSMLTRAECYNPNNQDSFKLNSYNFVLQAETVTGKRKNNPVSLTSSNVV